MSSELQPVTQEVIQAYLRKLPRLHIEDKKMLAPLGEFAALEATGEVIAQYLESREILDRKGHEEYDYRYISDKVELTRKKLVEDESPFDESAEIMVVGELLKGVLVEPDIRVASSNASAILGYVRSSPELFGQGEFKSLRENIFENEMRIFSKDESKTVAELLVEAKQRIAERLVPRAVEEKMNLIKMLPGDLTDEADGTANMESRSDGVRASDLSEARNAQLGLEATLLLLDSLTEGLVTDLGEMVLSGRDKNDDKGAI